MIEMKLIKMKLIKWNNWNEIDEIKFNEDEKLVMSCCKLQRSMP